MRLFKEMTILGLAAIAVIYLINPTAGFLELLPDNIPFVGNLDEATAMLILLNTLRHYGVDLTKLWARDDKVNREQLGSGSQDTSAQRRI